MSPEMVKATQSTEVSDSQESQPDELEATIWQTQFAEDMVIEDVKSRATARSTQAKPMSQRQKLLIFLGGVGVVAVVGLSLVGMLLRRTMTNGINGLLPQQNASEVTEQIQTALERDLLLLDQEIEAADPLQAKLAFPPVNFSLRLEDATVLQERAQSRSNTRR